MRITPKVILALYLSIAIGSVVSQVPVDYATTRLRMYLSDVRGEVTKVTMLVKKAVDTRVLRIRKFNKTISAL